MKDIEHKIKLNCYVPLVDWQLRIIQHINYHCPTINKMYNTTDRTLKINAYNHSV